MVCRIVADVGGGGGRVLRMEGGGAGKEDDGWDGRGHRGWCEGEERQMCPRWVVISNNEGEAKKQWQC